MSAESVQRKGSLEIKHYVKGRQVKRLVECPFCSHPFDDHEPRWKHYLDHHGPEVIPEPSRSNRGERP